MAPPATGVTPTVSGQMPGIAHMIQGATQNFSPYGISQVLVFHDCAPDFQLF
jgi:hypothetical protein